jgi:starch synthase
MVSAEVDPFARTGGLGDAVSGLSRALAELGADVLIVTPRYGVTRIPAHVRLWPQPVEARIGWGEHDVRALDVLEATLPARGQGMLRVCFLEHPGLFARDGLYGDAHGTFGDNDVRFVALSRGALAVATRVWPDGPDVIHAHDWHAAPAILSARLMMGDAWARTKTVLTIHNLAFQGVFGHDALDRLALPRAAFDDGTLAHDARVNFVRGAIALADRVTTVSPTYAREIQGPREGCGLDALLQEYAGKLVGILNGIDDASFDPATDTSLVARYDAAAPFDGREICKRALAEELGLEPGGGPLFASVSRLSEQKGIDLLLEILPALVGHGARVALVGQGDPQLEQAVMAAAMRHPGRVACRIAFDGSLARRVYAGADFFVVPSRYEPCGLTQLYAMRYGALPVVTAVGGLRDTVAPIRALFGIGTGIVAEASDTSALLVASEDALSLYRDAASYRAAVLRAMRRESSWRAPAQAYLELYADLLADEPSRRLP